MKLTTMPIDEAARIVDEFAAKVAAQGNEAATQYMTSQKCRYIHTLAHMPHGDDSKVALEVGTTEIFNIWMHDILRYGRVDCTVFDRNIEEKQYVKDGIRYFNADLERELIQVPDNTYDLVVCMEVLEHLSVDPMYMLAELNRITKPGGQIFLTTPNITSARGIWKMLRGEAPYLFYVYFTHHPYEGRHNLEYSPRILKETMEAAGYETESFWTMDTFTAPVPAVTEILNQLRLPTDMRGDNMFYIGRKVSGVKNRYPPALYYLSPE